MTDNTLTSEEIRDTIQESPRDGLENSSCDSNATHTGRLTFAHKARLKLGMTRAQFAEALCVNRFTVWRWETKGVQPLRIFKERIKEMTK